MNSTIEKYLFGLIVVMFISACQKEDHVPGDGQDTYINFYNAADGLIQNGQLSGNHLIHINDSTSDSRYPQFSSTDEFRQFPTSLTGTDFIVDNVGLPGGITYDRVYWLPLIAADYHFQYLSISADKTIKANVKATYVLLHPKTFNTQYLTESPENDTSYRIVNVPVERKGESGKVRIQVVNLSPDLGPLEIIQTDANGNKLPTKLPKALAFGSYSDYVALDTTGSSRSYGQLLLKFKRSGTEEILLVKTIPALSNSSFTIVIQGFTAPTIRKIRSIQTATTDYYTVTVLPNFRVNLRRVY